MVILVIFRILPGPAAHVSSGKVILKRRVELTGYATPGFAAAEPEWKQKNEGCQHM